jgi:hypothetical protein
MVKQSKWLAAFIFGMIANHPASAATISHHDVWDISLSPGNAVVNMPQFDPSLGTIFAVVLDINGVVSGNVTVENNSAIPGGLAGLQLAAEITAAGPDGILGGFAEFSSSTAQVGFGATDGVMGSGLDFRNFGTISSQAAATGAMLGGDFSAYYGVGTVPINFAGIANITSTGITLLTIDVQNFGAKGSASITYHYGPVPEPESWIMFALSVGGASLIFLRRHTASRRVSFAARV